MTHSGQDPKKVDLKPKSANPTVEVKDAGNADDLPENKAMSDAKAIPAKLKEKFDTYQHQDNETIIDTVSSKVVDTIGEQVDIDEDKGKKKRTGPLSPFEQFLNDTNLTFRQFLMFVGFIGFLILVVIFSIYLLFSFFGSEPKEVTIVDEPVTAKVAVKTEEVKEEAQGFISRLFGGNKTEEKVEPKVTKKTTTVKEAETKTETPESKEPVSVPTGIGKPVQVKFATASLKIAKAIGFGEITENKLSYFVRTYRKVRNIYNTDLFSYLSVVPDRKSGYDQFLIQFKGSFEELKIANEEMLQEIAALNARLVLINTQTAELENKFFTALDELESENLPDTLQAFQEISQKRSLILSELKAREAVAEKYSKAIPLIEEKIKAITLNEDPFVKGVKVVETDNIDLDLIIQEM